MNRHAELVSASNETLNKVQGYEVMSGGGLKYRSHAELDSASHKPFIKLRVTN